MMMPNIRSNEGRRRNLTSKRSRLAVHTVGVEWADESIRYAWSCLSLTNTWCIKSAADHPVEPVASRARAYVAGSWRGEQH